MANNDNLQIAKTIKNDEFHTQLFDIENELRYYRDHFRGKTILCNCDDPVWSSFWKYFHLNFEVLGLKKLISTHYDKLNSTYKLEYMGGNDANIEVGIKTQLEKNGDFRSPECVELLKESDIIVTNPPFSSQLPTELIQLCLKYDKKFLLVGPMHMITYKEFFPLVQKNKVWKGYTAVKEFKQPDGTTKKFGNISWYTNLDIAKRHENLILFRNYKKEDYQKYDGYNAINIDKIIDIPVDYNEVMGVPITFLDKFNPDQFEILGIANAVSWMGSECYTIINGKNIYNRILIRKKQENCRVE